MESTGKSKILTQEEERLFVERFRALTGFYPMGWQKRLYGLLLTYSGSPENFPRSVDLPTGLGKTSVMVLWLLALARQVERGRLTLPRRLVYVVNRRTVVDQSTNIAQDIRNKLEGYEELPEGDRALLNQLRRTLASMSAVDGPVVAISTLRGELADNGEWKEDPSRPAIIVGTVDMIGSKLLFSGYGDGRYLRPFHAGLLGIDTLLVHDEAHLTGPFSALLEQIVKQQGRTHARNPDFQGWLKRLLVLELSATTRPGEQAVFRLSPEDMNDPVVRQRVRAQKRLELHPSSNKVSEQIAALALGFEESRAKVLVYVRTPETALAVRKAIDSQLRKRSASKSKDQTSKDRIAVLTGTMRGYERDKLVRSNPVFRAFSDSNIQPEQTVYLVSTSAGEVGVDLDADHLVCDMTTLESMIQRLGRVNRRGKLGHVAEVHVVDDSEAVNKTSPIRDALRATSALLRKWGDGQDLSPQNLGGLLSELTSEEIDKAWSPQPKLRPATQIEFDALSLTSLDDLPLEIDVHKLLHGAGDVEPPQVYLVWRAEAELLARAAETGGQEELRKWFRQLPVRSHERLRAHMETAKAAISKAVEMLEKPETLALVITPRGQFDTLVLKKTEPKGKDNKQSIELVPESILVLPPELNCLSVDGLLTKSTSKKQLMPSEQMDVAEAEPPADDDRVRVPRRWLREETDEQETLRPLWPAEFEGQPPLGRPVELEIQKDWIVRLEEEDSTAGPRRFLLVYPAPVLDETDPELAPAAIPLQEHLGDVEAWCQRFASRLLTTESAQPVAKILAEAGRHHDVGKKRRIWQEYAGQPNDGPLMAKSEHYGDPRLLGGYRHEFGSLMDISRAQEADDLLLHLVAAHHGWARPSMSERGSIDPDHGLGECYAVSRRLVSIFGLLQERYGHWGLAWLEALLKAADIAASNKIAPRKPA